MLSVVDILRKNLKPNYGSLPSDIELVPIELYELGDVIIFQNFNTQMIYLIRSIGIRHYLVNVALDRALQNEERIFELHSNPCNGKFKFSKELLRLKPHRVVGKITIISEDRE